MKNSWKRPELVVLIRKRPDEVILQTCREGSGDPTLFNMGARLEVVVITADSVLRHPFEIFFVCPISAFLDVSENLNAG